MVSKKACGETIVLIAALCLLTACNFGNEEIVTEEPSFETMSTNIALTVAAEIPADQEDDGSAAEEMTEPDEQLPTETAAPTHTSAPPTETATATLTSTPTSEPTPTLSADDPKVDLGSPDFFDTMDTDQNWFGYDEASSKVEVKDGKLVFTVKAAQSGSLWTVALPSLEDFYLETVIQSSDNCEGKDHYGLFLRAPDPNKGMIFEASCDGNYRIIKWDGTDWEELISWSASGAIKTGGGETNRVGVRAQGDQYQMFVEGTLIAEVTDGEFKEGRFGFVAGSAETADLVIEFDDVAYWILE